MKRTLLVISILLIVIISLMATNKSIEQKKYNIYNSKFTSLLKTNSLQTTDLTKMQSLFLEYLKSASDNKLKGQATYNYRNEFFKIINKMDDKFASVEITSEQDINQINKKLLNTGIKAKTSEGIIYFVEDNDFSIQKIAPYLGKDWKDFYTIRISENNKLFDDGALVITKEELRRRIIAWEEFLIKYPNFLENSAIKAKLNCYISAYLRSQYDFSVEDNKISPESIKSFNNFLKENKDSKFYPIVKKWNYLLKDNDYKYSDKLEKFSYKSPYEVKKYNENIFDGFSP